MTEEKITNPAARAFTAIDKANRYLREIETLRQRVNGLLYTEITPALNELDGKVPKEAVNAAQELEVKVKDLIHQRNVAQACYLDASSKYNELMILIEAHITYMDNNFLNDIDHLPKKLP
jgi:hypothetical protein